MKYKIGNIVKIKSFKEIEKMCHEGHLSTLLIPKDFKSNFGFNLAMKEYCGKKFKIIDNKSYFYRLEGIECWRFEDWMIEEEKRLELE